MVKQKNRAFLFGGAADEEAKGGEVLISSFFNDLYQLNLEQMRWYPVAMRMKQEAAGATFCCLQLCLCACSVKRMQAVTTTVLCHRFCCCLL